MQFLRTCLHNELSSDNQVHNSVQVAEWSLEETGELIIIIITNPYNRACMGAVLHL